VVVKLVYTFQLVCDVLQKKLYIKLHLISVPYTNANYSHKISI